MTGHYDTHYGQQTGLIWARLPPTPRSRRPSSDQLVAVATGERAKGRPRPGPQALIDQCQQWGGTGDW